MAKIRQIESELSDYQNQLNELAAQANNGEISEDDFQTRLDELTVAILILAALLGANSDNQAAQQLENAAISVLNGDNSAIGTLTDSSLIQEALPESAIAELADRIDGSLSSTLASDIFNGQYEDNSEGLLSRLGLWSVTALALYAVGQTSGNPDKLFRWELGPTEKHCDDCANFDGQVMKGSEWPMFPGSPSLSCGGHRCLCVLVEVQERKRSKKKIRITYNPKNPTHTVLYRGGKPFLVKLAGRIGRDYTRGHAAKAQKNLTSKLRGFEY